MAVTAPTIAQARQILSARVLAIDATGEDYAQGGAWNEAQQPLLPGREPTSKAHLAYFVDDSRGDDTRDYRSNAPEGGKITTEVEIRFMYRVRPKNKIVDWDLAADAALAVIRQLTDWEPLHADGTTYADMVVRPSTAMIDRQYSSADEWLFVSVAVDVTYHLPLNL